MNATEETPKPALERLEEVRRERERAVEEVVAKYMAAAGIESLEELHRRFIETEHAYIPVPGLHRGKPVSFEVFKRSASGRDRFVYPQFMAGVSEVLGIDRRSKAGIEFMLAYVWGKRPA